MVLRIKLCTIRCAYATMWSLKILKRNYMEFRPCKEIHPYKQIHPWRSFIEFSDDLMKNLIFNKDGFVVLNKPYGIKKGGPVTNAYNPGTPIYVADAVHYTLSDALPYIANQLNYSNLTIVKCPERYMSGITLLAANEDIANKIRLAIIRTEYLADTFWIITIGIPTKLNDELRLAIKLLSHPDYKKSRAVIVSSWSKNDEKFREVKILKIKYKVLSNSILNLGSCIELTASTTKFYAIRQFASTYLYCPVLGDNICANQIQKIGNTYVRVNPFLSIPTLPKLNPRLLNLLKVSKIERDIIPTHIHLRSVFLPGMFKKDVTITAPLPPFFEWTCNQLELNVNRKINVSCKSYM